MCKFFIQRRWSVALGVLLIATIARAATPVLSTVLPRGGQRGTDVELVFQGDRLADAKEILFYTPGITVKKLEAASPQQLKVTATIAGDAALGEHPLRVRTATGISELRTFWVGAMPQVAEKEPNTEFAQPQKIDLNTTVFGVIENEDVDYFVVDAKKGQRITAEVEGIRLGGTMFDPYVAILDKNRFELAACDDTALLLQDPIVSIVAPRDDQYIIQLRESAYGGSGECHYRMHVGTFPRPRVAFPAGGQAGKELATQLIGDAAGAIAHTIALPAEPTDRFRLLVDQGGQTPPSANYLRVSTFPNAIEVEPNDEGKTATVIAGELPIAANGVIGAAGDVDHFRFKAKAGQVFDLNVFARRLRSPLDPVLAVFDATGKLIAENDDTAGPDSYLRFTSPAEGEYIVRVHDQLHGGGPEYVYRVEMVPVQPRLDLSIPLVAANSQERQTIVVPRGNRFATLVRATRADFAGDVKIRVDGLPAGVTATSDPVLANLDVVPVVFEAAADAPVGAKLCDVVADAVDPKVQFKSDFTQIADLVVYGNQVPYYQVKVRKLAVAVTDEAPFKLKIVQPKVPLVQTGSMQLKVIAERKEGFKAAINLAMPFNPPGVSSGGGTIAEGATEATIPLNASGDAQLRKWNVCVIGSAESGGPLWVSSQLAELEIAPPFVTGKIEMATAEQGKPAQVLCNIEQKTAFEGTAKVELLGLPPKTSSTAKEITAKDAKVIFDVKTEATSPTGQHNALFCTVTVMRSGEPMVQGIAAGGVLRIDAPPPAPAVAVAPPPPAAPTTAPAAPLSRLEKLRQDQAKRDAQGGKQ
jgi:hypothetical protein